ncbi:MAG: DUF805 domain-containing protein [Veillonella sp.]|nr:DUF805 domain-containing protein [Veillonella sp.]
MDTTMIFYIVKTVLICFLGIGFLVLGAQRGFSYFNFKGRMNRVQFAVFFLLALLALYIISNMVDMGYKTITTLPAYWGIQIASGLVHILLFPFIVVPLIGRMRDFDIFSVPAFILAVGIIFFYNYNLLTSTATILIGLFSVLLLLLIFIPGNARANKYGPPSLWPYKTEKNPFKHKSKPVKEGKKIKVRKRPLDK